eukprot:5235552-Alexandrium_andersonii.AAC.1
MGCCSPGARTAPASREHTEVGPSARPHCRARCTPMSVHRLRPLPLAHAAWALDLWRRLAH